MSTDGTRFIIYIFEFKLFLKIIYLFLYITIHPFYTSGLQIFKLLVEQIFVFKHFNIFLTDERAMNIQKKALLTLPLILKKQRCLPKRCGIVKKVRLL